jgi:DNA-binding CsgD family transcriptional regulator
MATQPLAIAKQLWEHYSPVRIVGNNEKNNLIVELANRLVHFFQPGDFYWLIFNISTSEIEYISQGIEKVLGYSPEEITLDFFFNNFHPEDQVLYVNSEKKVGEFLINLPPPKRLKYKIRVPLRIKKADGSYAQLLHQAMIIELNENGDVLRTLVVHADIGFLNPASKPTLSIIGFDGEPSFMGIDIQNTLIAVKEILSRREKEILVLIMNGMLNKEIAEQLNISKQTVDKHRKNMLEKTNCKNSTELVAKAIKNGWI